jgi:hypothetical protein
METTGQTEPRSWVGYMCPGCDGVFRQESGNGGRYAICPNCDEVLQLPGAGIEGDASAPEAAEAPPAPATDPRPPPVAAQTADAPPPEATTDADEPELGDFRTVEEANALASRSGRRRVRRKKRQRSRAAAQDLSWETTPAGSSDQRTPLSLKILLGAAAALALVASLLILGLWSGEEKGPAPPVAFYPDVAAPEKAAPEPGPASTTPALDAAMNPQVTLAQVEDAVTRFFEATSVDEIAPLVRNPEVSVARMKDYYSDRPVHPAGLRNVVTGSGLRAVGSLLSVAVELEDFTRKSIAFEMSADGLRIDWESWVGWCEMDWTVLEEKRPTTPTLMRSLCELVNYYNFDFNDEERWQSYQLVSQDLEHSIYGYARKGSLLDVKLRAMAEGPRPRFALTARVRYPEDATRHDQVIIDSIVSAGWVTTTDNSATK